MFEQTLSADLFASSVNFSTVTSSQNIIHVQDGDTIWVQYDDTNPAVVNKDRAVWKVSCYIGIRGNVDDIIDTGGPVDVNDLI